MKCGIITIVFIFWTSQFRSISCQNEICDSNGNIRLLGGNTNMEGTVQVCREGRWGGVRYCSQSEVDANVICNQLGYSPNGGVILDGVFMVSNADVVHYVSCLGNEDRVMECRKICDEGRHECCNTNVTLEVRCKERDSECSIVPQVALGAVASLLLVLLLISSICTFILWTKLRHSKQNPRKYETESHQYVEQQLGQAQVTTAEPDGPTYDDPVTFHYKKASSNQRDADYINTEKCVAYKPNAALAISLSSSTALPTFQPSSPNDEYEIMRQLTYNT